MAYYKIAERDPDVLTKQIKYSSLFTIPNEGEQIVPPEKPIEVGKIYTVDDLIFHAIVYSDNQAVTLLINSLDPKELHDLYNLLGVDDSILIQEDGTLTVKNYSAFLRILFNASYLTAEYSEKALGLLTLTKFNNGLVAGIPSKTLVAHKFGEAGFLDGLQQLHDCGIIYYPKHPYLLCVMTRGTGSVGQLESAIADVSKFVYDRIDEQYKNQ